MEIDADEFRQLIKEVAHCRVQRRFDDALRILDETLPTLQGKASSGALLEALYTAREAGYSDKVVGYAGQLEKIDPDLPTVKRILEGQQTIEHAHKPLNNEHFLGRQP